MSMLPCVASAIIVGWNITHSIRNGGAGYFRGLCRGLARQGLPTLFLQPVVEWSGDLPAHEPYQVASYQAPSEIVEVLAPYPAPRLVLKYLDSTAQEGAVLEALLAADDPIWLVDGDAPDTLACIEADPAHPLRALIPYCAGVLLATGGPMAAAHYSALGARRTVIWYAAADPQPLVTEQATCDLLFIGNRGPARDATVMRYLHGIMRLRPNTTLILAGAGWEGKAWSGRVQVRGHVAPEELTALYRRARLVLNLTRESQRQWGYCPSMRLFEAAAVGATLVSDTWPGMETVLTPEHEILLADSPIEVIDVLEKLLAGQSDCIGRAAWQRFQRQHTWDHRISELQAIVRQGR
ncbi:MAG: CgeB family protein [Armatimonadota bacterium]